MKIKMTEEEINNFINKEGQNLFLYLKEISRTTNIACMIVAVTLIHTLLNSSATEEEVCRHVRILFNDINANIRTHFDLVKEKEEKDDEESIPSVH